MSFLLLYLLFHAYFFFSILIHTSSLSSQCLCSRLPAFIQTTFNSFLLFPCSLHFLIFSFLHYLSSCPYNFFNLVIVLLPSYICSIFPILYLLLFRNQFGYVQCPYFFFHIIYTFYTFYLFLFSIPFYIILSLFLLLFLVFANFDFSNFSCHSCSCMTFSFISISSSQPSSLIFLFYSFRDQPIFAMNLLNFFLLPFFNSFLSLFFFFFHSFLPRDFFK